MKHKCKAPALSDWGWAAQPMWETSFGETTANTSASVSPEGFCGGLISLKVLRVSPAWPNAMSSLRIPQGRAFTFTGEWVFPLSLGHLAFGGDQGLGCQSSHFITSCLKPQSVFFQDENTDGHMFCINHPIVLVLCYNLRCI